MNQRKLPSVCKHKHAQFEVRTSNAPFESAPKPTVPFGSTSKPTYFKQPLELLELKNCLGSDHRTQWRLDVNITQLKCFVDSGTQQQVSITTFKMRGTVIDTVCAFWPINSGENTGNNSQLNLPWETKCHINTVSFPDPSPVFPWKSTDLGISILWVRLGVSMAQNSKKSEHARLTTYHTVVSSYT